MLFLSASVFVCVARDAEAAEAQRRKRRAGNEGGATIGAEEEMSAAFSKLSRKVLGDR